MIIVEVVLIGIIVLIIARSILSFIVPMSGARPHPMLLSLNQLVFQITEPLLGPIRRALPTFGGLDFSPTVVLIVLLIILRAI